MMHGVWTEAGAGVWSEVLGMGSRRPPADHSSPSARAWRESITKRGRPARVEMTRRKEPGAPPAARGERQTAPRAGVPPPAVKPKTLQAGLLFQDLDQLVHRGRALVELRLLRVTERQFVNLLDARGAELHRHAREDALVAILAV